MKLATIFTVSIMLASAAFANPAIDHKMGKTVVIDPAMKLEMSEKDRVIVPSWCAKWFDGCNHCALADKGAVTTAVCTGLVCEEDKTGEPYCTERKEGK